MSFGYIPDYKEKSFLKDIYLKIFGFPYAPRRNDARLVFQLLKPNKGEMILDLACGDGVWSNDLSKKDINVIGVDISLHKLKKAKERGEKMGIKCNLILGDAQNLPIKEKIFHKIFSMHTIEHIKDDTVALREFFRVLKPNGIMVICVPTGRISYLTKLAIKFPNIIKVLIFSGPVRESKNEEECINSFNKRFHHLRCYELSELKERLIEIGFIVDCINYSPRFLGSFFSSLFLTLDIFMWEKTPETDYVFKSQMLHGLLFPFIYPFYILDDVFFWKSGRGLIFRIKKR